MEFLLFLLGMLLLNNNNKKNTNRDKENSWTSRQSMGSSSFDRFEEECELCGYKSATAVSNYFIKGRIKKTCSSCYLSS